jgi:hypothetical protein
MDFWWDIDKLHKLDLPCKKIPTSELEWQLELPWWQHNRQYFTLSPIQVAANPEKYKEQYQRTLAAHLNHPIIVRNINGRWFILDGVHRLLKAHINTTPEVEIAIFADNLIPQILHD